MDKNGTVYEVHSFEHICRTFKDITGLVVHGKFEGDIVNLVDEEQIMAVKLLFTIKNYQQLLV